MDGNASYQDSRFTLEKVIRVLKRIVHEDVFLILSDEEIEVWRNNFSNAARIFPVFDFITYLVNKSNGKLECYGKAETLCANLTVIDSIPEFCRFSDDEQVELSETYFLNTNARYLSDTNGDRFVSKNDVCVLLYQYLFWKTSTVPIVPAELVLKWILWFANDIMKKLENCYEFVSLSVWKSIELELHEVGQKYYLIGQESSISEGRESCKLAFFEFLSIIDDTMRIVNRYIDVFTPFSFCCGTICEFQKPVVRFFPSGSKNYSLLTKEFENALKVVIKQKFADRPVPEGLILVESEEDKKLGILNAMTFEDVDKILKILGLDKSSFNFILVSSKRQHNFIKHPIVSSYGTHCKSKFDAFEDVFYYLAVVLKIFQGVKKTKLPAVLEWIDGLNDVFTHERENYFVEIWKIEEIIDRARRELQAYETEKIYEVPLKSFTMEEMWKEVKHMMSAFKPTELNSYRHMKSITKSINARSFCMKTLIVHDVHVAYFQVLRITIYNMVTANGKKISAFLKEGLQNQLVWLSKDLEQENDGFVNKVIMAKFSLIFWRDTHNTIEMVKKVEDNGDLSKCGRDHKKVNRVSDEQFDRAAYEVLKNIIPIIAHHSNEEFKPISEFKKVLTDYFRDCFDDQIWNSLKQIFGNTTYIQRILKPMDHLIELKVENKKLLFKKRKEYNVEPEQRKLIEQIEKYEMIRVKSLETEKELEARGQEVEKIKKQVQEILQKSAEDVQKSKEDGERRVRKLREELEESQKLKTQVAEDGIEMEKTLKVQITNIRHGYRDEIQKLKEEFGLKENKIQSLQEELKECRDELKKERERKYNEVDDDLKIAAENLRKMKIELENARLSEKTKDRAIFELKQQNEQLKIRIQIFEEKMNEKMSENLVREILDENQNDLEMINGILNSDNKLLKNDVVEISKKYDNLEKRVFSGLRSPIKLCPDVERIKNKYTIMIEKNYNDLVDDLSANLLQIGLRHPDSIDIKVARKEVADFDENLDEYMKNIRNELKKIQDNPNIRLGELELEIQEFPTKTFMKKYRKLMKKYSLKKNVTQSVK